MGKSISCLIVDDEPIARKGLESYVRHIGFLDLKDTCEDAFQLDERLKKEKIDLLFLDIQMPQLTGLEYIKQLSDPPKIIFTTAHAEYALQGFELDVLDYLLKPISKERFEKACLKAKDYFEFKSAAAGKPEFIFVKAEGKFEKIYFSEIIYVEAMENYLSIFTTNKKRLIVLSTLKSFLLTLPPEKFVQTHKSFIVAADGVTGIEGNSLFVGQVQIPIARKNKQRVMDFLVNRGN
jgi:two-component system, LytTR family, response regulator